LNSSSKHLLHNLTGYSDDDDFYEDDTISDSFEEEEHFQFKPPRTNPPNIIKKEMFANLFDLAGKDKQCTICLDEEDLCGLACGHCFCHDCLIQYLNLEIQQRKIRHTRSSVKHVGDALQIEIHTLFGVVCPHLFCNRVIEDVDKLLSKTDVANFDEKCLDAALLEMRKNRELNPCPLGCGYFVQEDCLCVNPDCRKKQLKMRLWAKRQKLTEEQFLQRLRERELADHGSKRCCPNCLVEIEKQGGCDHMQCTFLSYSL